MLKDASRRKFDVAWAIDRLGRSLIDRRGGIAWCEGICSARPLAADWIAPSQPTEAARIASKIRIWMGVASAISITVPGKIHQHVQELVFEISTPAGVRRVKLRADRTSGGAVKWLELLPSPAGLSN